MPFGGQLNCDLRKFLGSAIEPVEHLGGAFSNMGGVHNGGFWSVVEGGFGLRRGLKDGLDGFIRGFLALAVLCAVHATVV